MSFLSFSFHLVCNYFYYLKRKIKCGIGSKVRNVNEVVLVLEALR